MIWLKENLGTAVKAAAIVFGIGGGALTFFVNLKTDVATLQSDTIAMQSDIGDIKDATNETNRKVDKLYEFFISSPFATRQKL